MATTDRRGIVLDDSPSSAVSSDPYAGLAIKAPVRAATTANVTLSGEQTVDGVALVAGNRVLVFNQTAPIENGIYLVSTGPWERTRDFDGYHEVVKGTQVFITDGTLYGAKTSEVTSSDPITIGTSAITWSTPFSAQPLDATLTALAGLDSSAGFLVQTGADAFTKRSLQAPAAGFTITNPAGTAGNATFVLANDLAALEGLSSTGFAVRSATDTWVQRTLANASAGLTWTNGDGISGNPTPVFANDLGAVEGLASTGMAARTATDTWAVRTLTGTANQIVVTNGDGVSGNPTLALPSTVIIPAGGSVVSTDPAFVVAKTVQTATVGGSHPFSDNSFYDVSSGTYAAASFDALPFAVGTFSYNHFAGFQSRVAFQSSGTLTNMYGLIDVPTMNAGTVSNRYGVSVWDVGRSGGTLTNNYGVYVKELLEGGTKYAVFTAGATPSSFGGSVSFGAALTPIANDGAALGTTSLKFSDLFLASGAVVNFNSGDATITHSSDTLTFASAASGYVFADGQILANLAPWMAKSISTAAGGVAVGFFGVSALGVYIGSGAPTVSAAQGSLYLRTDGSSASTRMYVNTNGSTGWTNVVTAT